MDKKSFFGNWIVKNILLGVLVIALLLGATSLFLSLRTHHGKEIEVPDMMNMTYEDAARVAEAAGVKLHITDSVYQSKMPKGAIVNQTPKGGSMVKPGRTISLVTNSFTARKVKMPSLVGVSLRQALAELNAKGLVVSELKYVSDIATNSVLRQLYRGKDIAAGKEIASGSSIVLVIGLNSTESTTYIPKLRGYKYQQAINSIHDNSLNVSNVKFDATVHSYSDSLNARVYAQSPASDGTPVLMGSKVSIQLTLDEDKLKEGAE